MRSRTGAWVIWSEEEEEEYKGRVGTDFTLGKPCWGAYLLFFFFLIRFSTSKFGFLDVFPACVAVKEDSGGGMNRLNISKSPAKQGQSH